MPHLKPFARLHVAGPGDLAALSALDASLRSDSGPPNRNWSSDAANRDNHIVMATECEAVTGAAEIVHPAGAAVATLVWLGVANSARGRGIGQLLLESASERARGEGAAVLRLGSMALSADALGFLTASGFVERNYEAANTVFEKSLWDERAARQTRSNTPHFYGLAAGRGSSAAALMLAMATIDSRFMMTPQVERGVAAEINQEGGGDGNVLLGLATAAARRSFNVAVHCALLPPLPQDHAPGEGIISASLRLPTAEELVGLLARRRIPLVRAGFERMNAKGTEHDWLVVLGFDGMLFQIFDPRRPDQRDHAVTLAEMRQALGGKHAACLVIGRN